MTSSVSRGVTIELRVIRAQMASDGTGMNGFVVRSVLQPNGKGLNRCRCLRLHQGDDGGRIHPAGKEGPEGHIGNRLEPNRLAQPLLERADCCGLVPQQGSISPVSTTWCRDHQRRSDSPGTSLGACGGLDGGLMTPFRVRVSRLPGSSL